MRDAILCLIIIWILLTIIFNHIAILISGFFIILLGVLFLILRPKYKHCEVQVYIRGKLTNNIYKAEIKEIIAPKVYLEYTYHNKKVKKFDISDSMILVSKDPMIAKVLYGGKHIKANTIANNCTIMIKNQGLKFWECLKNYKGLTIVVEPGPPSYLEIIEVK